MSEATAGSLEQSPEAEFRQFQTDYRSIHFALINYAQIEKEDPERSAQITASIWDRLESLRAAVIAKYGIDHLPQYVVLGTKDLKDGGKSQVYLPRTGKLVDRTIAVGKRGILRKPAYYPDFYNVSEDHKTEEELRQDYPMLAREAAISLLHQLPPAQVKRITGLDRPFEYMYFGPKLQSPPAQAA